MRRGSALRGGPVKILRVPGEAEGLPLSIAFAILLQQPCELSHAENYKGNAHWCPGITDRLHKCRCTPPSVQCDAVIDEQSAVVIPVIAVVADAIPDIQEA